MKALVENILINPRGSLQLWMLQRISAVVLALAVLVHLAVIITATQQSMSAEAIIERYQGSVLWPLGYTVFVLAVAVHAPIGIYNVLREWSTLSRTGCAMLSLVFAVVLVVLGLYAVLALAFAP